MKQLKWVKRLSILKCLAQGHKTDHGTDTAHSHWVCIYTRALCVALIWVCLCNGPTQTTQMGHISLTRKDKKLTTLKSCSVCFAKFALAFCCQPPV